VVAVPGAVAHGRGVAEVVEPVGADGLVGVREARARHEEAEREGGHDDGIDPGGEVEGAGEGAGERTGAALRADPQRDEAAEGDEQRELGGPHPREGQRAGEGREGDAEGHGAIEAARLFQGRAFHHRCPPVAARLRGVSGPV
jgi:hypothetical protein